MQELESAYSDQTFPAATDAALSNSQATAENSGGKKTEEVWTHLPHAIYFTVNFFLVRTCPNSLMIQFMANTFQPITFLQKG